MAPIIATTAAIFLHGQCSAANDDNASSARASQKKVPAASTMCRPEIETTFGMVKPRPALAPG